MYSLNIKKFHKRKNSYMLIIKDVRCYQWEVLQHNMQVILYTRIYTSTGISPFFKDIENFALRGIKTKRSKVAWMYQVSYQKVLLTTYRIVNFQVIEIIYMQWWFLVCGLSIDIFCSGCICVKTFSNLKIYTCGKTSPINYKWHLLSDLLLIVRSKLKW